VCDTHLIDPPNAVCWCSKRISGSANQLTRVDVVCTCSEVEGAAQMKMSGQ
jgi:hypothetical protein